MTTVTNEVPNWKILIAEIMFNYFSHEIAKDIKSVRISDTDPNEPENFENIPSFGEFERIGHSSERDDMCANREFVFVWKGQHYKFIYEYRSYHGDIFDDAKIIKVEPETITRVNYW